MQSFRKCFVLHWKGVEGHEAGSATVETSHWKAFPVAPQPATPPVPVATRPAPAQLQATGDTHMAQEQGSRKENPGEGPPEVWHVLLIFGRTNDPHENTQIVAEWHQTGSQENSDTMPSFATCGSIYMTIIAYTQTPVVHSLGQRICGWIGIPKFHKPPAACPLAAKRTKRITVLLNQHNALSSSSQKASSHDP